MNSDLAPRSAEYGTHVRHPIEGRIPAPPYQRPPSPCIAPAGELTVP